MRGLWRLRDDLGVRHLKLGESLPQGPLGLAELGCTAVDESPEGVYGDSGIRGVPAVELHSRHLSEPHGGIRDPVAGRDSQDLVHCPLSLILLLRCPQAGRVLARLRLLRRGALRHDRRRIGRRLRDRGRLGGPGFGGCLRWRGGARGNPLVDHARPPYCTLLFLSLPFLIHRLQP